MTDSSEQSYEIEIEEGHAGVPWFLKISFTLLFIALFVYFVDYMVGAQPSSAQMKSKSDSAKEAPANPGEGEPAEEGGN